MNELKPCPCCKGRAKISLEEQDNPVTAFCNLYCTNCGLQIWEKTKEKAIETWNTRPDNWISVDTMPDMCGMPVLLVGVNGYGQTRVFQGFTGYMETGRLLFHSNQRDVDINYWKITHWQPLPQPPKGSE